MSFNLGLKAYDGQLPAWIPTASGGGGSNGLGAVLAINNSAADPTTSVPQSATDFDDIGCVSIQTGKVYQGNNLAL